MECGQRFPSHPFVVLTVDQFVGHGGGPLEQQKQDSHVYRKTGTMPLIFRKNQSRYYINDEVQMSGWQSVAKPKIYYFNKFLRTLGNLFPFAPNLCF